MMMKKYDPNIKNGIHTVKITLQLFDYVGHIINKIGGNCKGKTILDYDFECECEFPDNDCELEYHEDGDYFSCVLRNEKGDPLECENDAQEMNNMIVAVEILDYQEKVD
ncbi:MAG TPA: DUF5406 domain-containing protein [Candidatus Blautia faecipullorum]|nr:DUF5406 domain-containing protein [Candidatus Blautia faecipullorum]